MIPEIELRLMGPLDGVKSMLELGNKVNKGRAYKTHFEALGIRHVSVDRNGMNGALPMDLMEPLELGGFDMVTNFGTTEHVARQEPVWRNVVNAAVQTIVSITPAPGGWSDHGLWYPSQVFYRQLVSLNGFDVEQLFEYRDRGHTLLACRMRRFEGRGFTMPPNELMVLNATSDKYGNIAAEEGRGMSDYFEAHGFMWPHAKALKEQSPGKMKKNYIDRAPDMQVAVDLCKQRRVVVQAGGHCGVWPLWLADRFETVYTFEPDRFNFHCLAHNVDRPNVFPARAMLGAQEGPRSLTISTKWIGAHHGTNEPGPVPVVILDRMHLPCLDALILDVEGMEWPALLGAQLTVQRFRPIIMLEDRGHGEKYGFGGYETIRNWLMGLNYAEAKRVAKDVVWQWQG